MLSAITLGLRGLQVILAIALLGLSISLLRVTCDSEFKDCDWPLERAFVGKDGPRTVRYCVFLGVYGMLVAAIGAAALFIDRIPTIVPLVGDSFGALCFLAGGIAWIVNTGGRIYTCGQWNNVPDDEWKKWYSDGAQEDFTPDRKKVLNRWVHWLKDITASACRQGNAEHGLAWALFVFTTCLVICDYLRRRDQAKSSK